MLSNIGSFFYEFILHYTFKLKAITK